MDGTQGQTARSVLAPTAEQVKEQTNRGRRDFLRAAGLGGLTLALGACAESAASSVLGLGAPQAPSRATGPNDPVVLDFSTDFGVLNYAYALEQLEAAFYTMVVANAAFASTFSAGERIVLTDLRDHEIVHRDFFKAALGANAIGELTADFSAVNFASRDSVLTTARTFEDLGVGAYNGAGKYLRNADFLTVAGKIVSVEARHASAIRDLIAPRTGAFAPNAFDPAMTPMAVLMAADPFITNPVSVINA
jgi:rubrerythrin